MTDWVEGRARETHPRLAVVCAPSSWCCWRRDRRDNPAPPIRVRVRVRAVEITQRLRGLAVVASEAECVHRLECDVHLNGLGPGLESGFTPGRAQGGGMDVWREDLSTALEPVDAGVAGVARVGREVIHEALHYFVARRLEEDDVNVVIRDLLVVPIVLDRHTG